MPNPPSGMLSLTYHLAYDKDVQGPWLRGEYSTVFAAFGITDPKLQKSIGDLNEKLGEANNAYRNSVVDQWMVLVGNDVKSSAADPNILW